MVGVIFHFEEIQCFQSLPKVGIIQCRYVCKVDRETALVDRFTSKRDGEQGSKEAIEYFLTKLKRVDNELVVSSAELREINEEISLKNAKIEQLKMRLENLIRDEKSREIKRLERMKTELKENVKKADRVLAGLGLIWVGEQGNAPRHDLGGRFVADSEGPGYRPDWGYHKIRQNEGTVTPFTGMGYRLGTGSEIFTQQADTSLDQAGQSLEPAPERLSKKIDVNPKAETTSNLTVKNVSSSDNRIRPVHNRPSKAESFEKLPLEFRRMSESERRRALKQVAVQIQKNMDKYTI